MPSVESAVAVRGPKAAGPGSSSTGGHATNLRPLRSQALVAQVAQLSHAAVVRQINVRQATRGRTAFD